MNFVPPTGQRLDGLAYTKCMLTIQNMQMTSGSLGSVLTSNAL